MPYLGDYLGHVLAEITTARVQADLEAVKVAELYANHPLLRHLAVPRFRMPTLTIDIPVALKEVVSLPDNKPLSTTGFWREIFDRLLGLHLEKAGVQLSGAQKAGIDSALSQVATHIAADKEVPGPVTLADTLSAAVGEALRGARSAKKEAAQPWLEPLVRDLTTATREEFVRLQSLPARLQVLATASELKDAGPVERLVRINVSITEDAFEWTTVESDGKTETRLVPE